MAASNIHDGGAHSTSIEISNCNFLKAERNLISTCSINVTYIYVLDNIIYEILYIYSYTLYGRNVSIQGACMLILFQ